MAKTNTKRKPEIKNWYKDRYQQVLLQRKLLAAISIASLVCTLAVVIVLMRMLPLKTIEPYVIQVDQRSGVAQVVDPLALKELTANEAVNNYFIVQYIRAREGYAAADLVRNYDMVRIMSEPSRVYEAFRGWADANNPESNVARLGNLGVRQVRFKSITYINPTVVQARILIEEKSDGITVTAQYHRIVLLQFEYTKMNLNAEERYVNPLGFRVVDYRVDEDVVPQ